MHTPWKIIAAFVGVFIAGAIFGGFFTLGVAARRDAPASSATQAEPVSGPTATPEKAGFAGGRRPAPGHFWQAPQLLRRYAERLNLTPEQKERILPLLKRAADDYRRVQQTNVRETGIILHRLQEDLRKELTPEQQAKLAEMERRQHELIRKFGDRPGLREWRKGPGRGAGAEERAPQADEAGETPSGAAEQKKE